MIIIFVAYLPNSMWHLCFNETWTVTTDGSNHVNTISVDWTSTGNYWTPLETKSYEEWISSVILHEDKRTS